MKRSIEQEFHHYFKQFEGGRYEPDYNSEIRALTLEDVTSKHFVNWFFDMDDWIDTGETPETFDYGRLVPHFIITENKEYCQSYAYGYFVNDFLEGVICILDKPELRGMFVDFLFVNPDKQNGGVGSKLMAHVIERFGSKNDIYLDVKALNSGGIRFYERFGFKKLRSFIHHERGGTDALMRCYTMKREKMQGK